MFRDAHWVINIKKSKEMITIKITASRCTVASWVAAQVLTLHLGDGYEGVCVP